MTERDAEAAWIASQAAFEARGEHWPPSSEPVEMRHRRGVERVLHLLRTDPGGAWVAQDGRERIRGVAMALVREGVWGLSLLAVEPGAQSSGVGGRLLERALAHGDGTRGQIVLSSQDPRAMRAYARAGFRLEPTVGAFGVVRRGAAPADQGVRGGGEDDFELAREVDRAVRGAAHGPDYAKLLETGHDMLVLPGRGYAFERDGSPALLAARDEDAARALLWAVLARARPGFEVGVMFLTAAQNWALDVALAAGLELETGGPTFVRGELGPLSPYLPSAAYL